jgi:hypothetical protein
MSTRDAVDAVAAATGAPRRRVYDLAVTPRAEDADGSGTAQD